MQCKFCNQDVEKPCHNNSELSDRASAGIGRCRTALINQGSQDDLPAVDDEKGWYNG